jgi:hypothetical protein
MFIGIPETVLFFEKYPNRIRRSSVPQLQALPKSYDFDIGTLIPK